ncbi:MAG: hypothetical protein KDC03_20450 [Flavobacteriales bacterium]|nr:hypothetical protein [Flavobacteriales bacterium]
MVFFDCLLAGTLVTVLVRGVFAGGGMVAFLETFPVEPFAPDLFGAFFEVGPAAALLAFFTLVDLATVFLVLLFAVPAGPDFFPADFEAALATVVFFADPLIGFLTAFFLAADFTAAFFKAFLAALPSDLAFTCLRFEVVFLAMCSLWRRMGAALQDRQIPHGGK